VPELPDVQAYLEALEPRVLGQTLVRVRLKSPFLVRSVAPPLSAVEGRRVVGLRRLGKRVVFAFEGDLFLVLHLMIAGRLRWRDEPPKIGSKAALAVSNSTPGTCCSPRRGRRGAPPSTSSRARRRSPATTPAASSRSKPTSPASGPRSSRATTRSSAR
jgi:formamidopyrimidine-DNA glycosylase